MRNKAYVREIIFTIFVGIVLALAFIYTLGDLIAILVCGFSNERACSIPMIYAIDIIPSVILAAALTIWKLLRLKKYR